MRFAASLATVLATASLVPALAQATEVPVQKIGIEAVEGKPLTSVVVTQCNLIVAVYVTMPDGKLLRFDKSDNVPADKMLGMAYSAARSERVEVACETRDGVGAVGYEKHESL